MADVKVTINGKTINVPAGTNIVDAARMVDTAVPVFCYHPKMKPVGMCRMCLVQVGTPKVDPATRQPVLNADGTPVIAMMPKLQTGCTTPVSEGMVVNTVSDDVKFAQKGVLEFLLTSHPLDCPVCDKGGECPLQNLTMEFGPGNSRFEYNDKVHFQKPVPLGDLIFLDRERCILCSRCVRFQDEIADDQVLGFDQRGRNWQIISKSEPGFDSKYSGNTTDICPVGALTTSDFRFKARVWELQSKPAVCTLCPVGCNISLDMRHDELKRVMPRENSAVNEIWLCDKGRFGHRFLDAEGRLTQPLIRRNGKLVAASWDEALELVAEKLGGIARAHGGAAVAGLADARLSNEDFYVFQKLLRGLGSANIDMGSGAFYSNATDEIGAQLGVGTGTDLSTLGKGTTVIVIGADPEEEAPLYMLRLRGIAQRGGTLITASQRPAKLERSATKRVRYAVNGDRAFLRGVLKALLQAGGEVKPAGKIDGLAELISDVKRTSAADLAAAAGVSEAEFTATAEAYRSADNAIIVYGSELRSSGAAAVDLVAALALTTGKYGKANSGVIALLPGGNSRGGNDMGVRPDRGPGYSAAPRGLSAAEVWPAVSAGTVRGLWLAGVDAAAALPAAAAAIKQAEFTVVQDLFLTATAELADVVLPAAAVAEREGSYTNAERRVQRSRQARPAVGDARADWQIIAGVATALQAAPAGAGRSGSGDGALGGWDYLTVSEIADEIAATVSGYRGISYRALAATGNNGGWGRQPNEAVYYDGTSYTNTEGVGLTAAAGKPALTLQRGNDTPAAPADRLLLLHQPLAYDDDVLLRGSKLQTHIAAAHVVLATADAQRLGVSAGETVSVSTQRGSISLPVRVVADLPRGLALVPATLPGSGAAAIADGARSWVTVTRGGAA
jgi:NADH-quinone oxidoreductase subunit G